MIQLQYNISPSPKSAECRLEFASNPVFAVASESPNDYRKDLDRFDYNVRVANELTAKGYDVRYV